MLQEIAYLHVQKCFHHGQKDRSSFDWSGGKTEINVKAAAIQQRYDVYFHENKTNEIIGLLPLCLPVLTYVLFAPPPFQYFLFYSSLTLRGP